MVGLGDENCNFVFELTYNYGIDGYKQGNDLQCIALAMPEVGAGVRARSRARVRARANPNPIPNHA